MKYAPEGGLRGFQTHTVPPVHSASCLRFDSVSCELLLQPHAAYGVWLLLHHGEL